MAKKRIECTLNNVNPAQLKEFAAFAEFIFEIGTTMKEQEQDLELQVRYDPKTEQTTLSYEYEYSSKLLNKSSRFVLKGG